MCIRTRFDKTNEGRRVELIHTDDPYTHLKAGDKGTYEMCLLQPDGRHQHCIKWDNGSTLMMLEGIDHFRFIETKNGMGKSREEALEALKLLLMVPMNDIKEMMDCIERKDHKKLKEVTKRIRDRKAKYGF